MPLSSFIGNERVKQLLLRLLSERRIGQGLIFSGPRGVGKYQFALTLAQALNCESCTDGDPCGKCPVCHRIAAGEHLDVRFVSPDGQFIKIAQTRELSLEAQFRPYEGRHRVIIVDEADRLRIEASNSILKTLEEPPELSLIVLVTSKPYALLETIRSRCQRVNFGPLTESELESYLIGIARTSDKARLLARLARGSIGTALAIDLDEYLDKRRVMMELLDAYFVQRDTVRLIKAAEYLGKKLEKDEFINHVDVLMTLLSDLFHLKLGKPAESLINVDIADRLERAAEPATIEAIASLVERLENVLLGLARNLSRQIAMEAALVA